MKTHIAQNNRKNHQNVTCSAGLSNIAEQANISFLNGVA